MNPRPAPRIASVVLAAGSSRRMGAVNKLLAPVDGAPVVVNAVQALLGTEVEAVLVVTGHDSAAVENTLRNAFPDHLEDRLRFLQNPNHRSGMGTSIAAGVAHLEGAFDGMLIVLGDMPSVRTDTLGRLIGRWGALGSESIVAPTFDGMRGNPVLFGAPYRKDLMALSGDTGARAFLDRVAEHIEEVPVDDPGVLRDIDTPADLVM